ncbi:MAG: GvpL/GvpF family gas vesicle protein [Candidatus Atribacteria bacterium]|nr:GvpL/GvpF family gas vesicle protein [Candidatus Atribacteria bacterium]
MPVGRYIYGFIEEPQRKEFSFPGIDGKKVYSFNYQDLAAVLSETEVIEYDPTRENLLAHTHVLEEIVKEHLILPMSFGIIAENEEKVAELLRQNYLEFKRELKILKGKIELGVKVLWIEDAVVKEMESRGKDFQEFKKKIVDSSGKEDQNTKLKIGKLVESIVKEWEKKYVQKIYSSLQEIATDSRINQPIGIKMLLNSSFLVDKNKEKNFDKRVNELAQKYENKLKFKYVGPVPPYNFVNIKLKGF